ncbi:1,4-alpha-glucan branching protein GlgB [Anaerolineales bacterium HSG6]|nr:1,4-alpha-glucan branching protein GlgB [Anaerolineales bacterium HSG6]
MNGIDPSTEWLTDYDKHLFSEGNHERLYEKMGAHLIELNGQNGVHFSVWAPNATQIEIVGDFNDWDGSNHRMFGSESGIWTMFIPDMRENTLYKYRIITPQGEKFDKSDPFGFYMEQRPKTGSKVCDIDSYEWNDAEWISKRPENQAFDKPLSIYEVHLGSWKRLPDPEWVSRYLTYRELAEHLLPYVVEMGYTHIELMPISEYPLDASWGYQVLGFYAATSRYGTPQDLMYFIDQCHQQGIGVILDWVPGHFPKDGSGLNFFDGTHLFSHSDPRQGEHPDWGTMVFNYDRHEVRSFLLANAVFWLDKYHFDGLRVDAVASMLYLDYSREEGQWIPNQYGGRENLGAIQFLRKTNEVVHGLYPGVMTIAEESTAWPMVSRPTYLGGLGFSLKWNMGWMHDTLRYMSKDPIHRRYHHNDLTFGLLYAFNENFVLPLSHDEVVHGKGSLINKMPGDDWQKFANLRAYYTFMWAHPGKNLLFMGCEFGQWAEWNFNGSLDWEATEHGENHKGMITFMKELNRLYKETPALYEDDFEWTGFEWIDANDHDNSVLSFLRKAKYTDECVIVIGSYTPVPRENYYIGVPEPGFYDEIFNSDRGRYWGGDVNNGEGVQAEEKPMHGYDYAVKLTLPPLATVILKVRKKLTKVTPAVEAVVETEATVETQEEEPAEQKTKPAKPAPKKAPAKKAPKKTAKAKTSKTAKASSAKAKKSDKAA